MRELINIIESELTEATGLAGRNTGDIFVDENGNEVLFTNLKFYPETGRFDTKEEMIDLVVQVGQALQSQDVEVVETNGDRGMLAFGVAQFSYPDGKVRAYIRYFKQIAYNFRANFWDNGAIPGLKLGKKSSVKLRAGYAPSDVLTQLENLTPQDIIDQIAAKFGADSVFTTIAQQVAQGGQSNIEVPAESINFEAFRDLFCEMLHPIALMSGFYTGNAGTAEKKFLKNEGFGSTLINFSTSKTEGLSDSLLVSPSGATIKVSSKSKVNSAKAGIGNIANEVSKLEPGNNLYKKYQAEIEFIQWVDQNPATTGVINYAEKIGLIDSNEALVIKGLAESKESWININNNLDGIQWMTPKLKKMWQRRKPADPAKAVPFYHMVTATAFELADYMNTKSGFSQAASVILNNGALLQIYTNVKNMGGKIIIFPFQTTYPGETVTGVLVDAGTRYKSTSIDGKLGFEILRNGAKPMANDDQVDGNPPSKTAATISKPKPPGTTMGVDDIKPSREKRSTNVGSGRERR
jgi:hypothetical protein